MKYITLLSLGLLILGSPLCAQNTELSFGYVKTELEKNAVSLAIDYAKDLNQDLAAFAGGKNWLVSFDPELEVLVGSDDSFNGISAKYVGNFMTFKTAVIAGVPGVPDLSKTFYNFPIALGVETNQSFNAVNGLLEAGFVPWYQNATPKQFLKQTKVGFFLQAGHKFAVNDSIAAVGGDIDQSDEKTENSILRAKASASVSPTFYFNVAHSYGCSIIGNGSLWYDFLNSEVYYKIEGKFRIILAKDYSLDFGYEKGSGAPNFNEGDQFTTNLAIRF